MSDSSSVSPGLFRSAFSCSLIIFPVVALLYLIFNSQVFRDSVCELLAAAFAMVISVIEAGSTLSPLILYVLIGGVYWIECVTSKVELTESSVSTRKCLLGLQILFFISSIIMAVPHIYGTSMPIMVSIVMFCHAVFGSCCIADSLQGIVSLMTPEAEVVDPDEVSDEEHSEFYEGGF